MKQVVFELLHKQQFFQLTLNNQKLSMKITNSNELKLLITYF